MAGRVEQYVVALAGFPLVAAASRLVRAGAVTTKLLAPQVVWGTVEDGDLQQGLAVHTRWQGERLVDLRGTCPACADQPCVHAVAVALAHWAGADLTTDDAGAAAGGDAWQEALQALTGTGDDDGRAAQPLALQVELQPGAVLPGVRRGGRLLVRPAVPARNAAHRWVTTGVSWSTVVRETATGEVPALLRELRRLCTREDDRRPAPSARPAPLDLQDAATARVWALLADLAAGGVTLVRHGSGAPVVVEAPVTVEVTADRPDDAVLVGARFLAAARDGAAGGPVELDPARVVVVGRPGHGVAWWDDAPHDSPTLHLAATSAPVPDALAALLAAPLRIPPQEEEVFATTYYPALRRRLPVRATAAAALPEPLPTELVARLSRPEDDELAVVWSWRTGVSTQRRDRPLHGFVGVDAAEQQRRADQLAAVTQEIRRLPATTSLLDLAGRLRERGSVRGEGVVALRQRLVPALVAAGVVVEAPDDLPELHAAQAPPRVEFVTHETPTYTDWFELAVTVTVDGERIALADLMTAMSTGQQVYVSRFGTVVRLDAPELVRLAELVLESQLLHDAPLGLLRVGRAQAGVLFDVEDVGRLSGPAADWTARLRALADARAGLAGDDATVPDDVTATLRPYQVDGFRWLATLYGLGLGGVLADDMGLGKTLQVLTLVCHARRRAAEEGRPAPRFLVVAPTSVVHTWQAQAARFAPDLRVAVVDRTLAKRRTPVADLRADADVVVTSWTLLRLEADAYRALEWDGVVLDEAQVVKNRRTALYRHAAALRAPFRLAVTGTPVENRLEELWSLVTLVAPGVLGSAGAFQEMFAIRIEQDRDPATLARLRRRIAPIMLRRSKSDVAADLPDRVEQVVELDLRPEHREAYDRLLQRERQRVLGLIPDDEHLDSNRFAVLRSLGILRQAANWLGLVDADTADLPCAKLDALAELASEVAAEGHRVLVFSQYTRFLRAARDRLEEEGVACAYLDGATRRREEAVEGFREGSAAVFLISLKAGGTGLTLTEADYCVVLDPWWNPAVEAQAVDRAHRIGQTRKVNVYRFVARGTIEEKVMALKDRKAALVTSVLDAGDLAGAAITAEDVRELLR